jgi:hypothetical protein
MKIIVKNPLAKTYQYEYAMFLAVSELFAGVSYRSRLIESLKLYYFELPVRSDGSDKLSVNGKSREDYVYAMSEMVKRDVVGDVKFPMMNVCKAEVKVRTLKNGTHSFFFTDGIYAFRVHLKMEKGKKALSIDTRVLNDKNTKKTVKRTATKIEKGAA